MYLSQADFDVRCEWGPQGLENLAPAADVVVVVDVLSFTTAVDIAVSRGGVVFPYPLKDAAAFASSVGGAPASRDRAMGYSLSPASLLSLPSGYRLVLPSPNGAALFFGADHAVLLAACLRNASAVARAAASLGASVAVIPAGEKWADGSLRPGIEDLIGAGAVISGLPGRRSPEAALACAAFERFQAGLAEMLRESVSGKELIGRDAARDLVLAAELNVSETVPRLVNGLFEA